MGLIHSKRRYCDRPGKLDNGCIRKNTKMASRVYVWMCTITEYTSEIAAYKKT